MNVVSEREGTYLATLLRCTLCAWRGTWTDVGLHMLTAGHTTIESEFTYRARVQAEYQAAQQDPRRG